MKKSAMFLLVTILLLAVSAVGYAAASDYEYEVISEEEKTCRITAYNGEEEKVTIPERLDGYLVTGIGDKAFYDNEIICEVVMPESITRIGKNAFSMCWALKSVVMPPRLDYSGLGSGAFYYCKSLESIVVPDGVGTVPILTFMYCESLQSVELPDTVIMIDANAFTDCKQLRTLTLPASLTSIGEWAFRNCTELTELHFAGNTNSSTPLYIEYWMFDGCTNLRTISFGDGNYSIGADAFSNMQQLTSLTFGKGQYTVADGAFSGCTSLTSVNMPDSVTEIGENAFRDTGIERLTLPAKFVDNLYDCGFGEKLTELTIVGELETFDIGVLSGLFDLRKLVLPDSVKNIVQTVYGIMPEAMESMNMPLNLEFVEIGWLVELARDTVVLDVYHNSEGYRFAQEWGFKYRLLNANFTSITAKPLSIFPGQIGRLLLETEPEIEDFSKFVEPQFLFTSGNPDIATVDENGYVTGHAVGTATITIQDKDDPFMYTRAEVTVNEGNIVKSLAFIQIKLNTDDEKNAKLDVVYGVDGLYPPYDISLKVTGEANQEYTHEKTEGTVFAVFPAISLNAPSDKYTFNYDFVVTVVDANGSVDTAHGSFTVTREYTPETEQYVLDPATGRVVMRRVPEHIDWTDLEIIQDYGANDKITELSFTVSQMPVTVGKSASVPYQATTEKGNSSDAVYFTSSDTSVVRVEPDGTITGVAPGTATVTVHSADGTGLSSTLQVICADSFVEGITIEAGEVDRETLQQQLTAVIQPAESSGTALKWSSSDESIATVDEQGVVTWHNAGFVTFTTAAMDGSGVTATFDYLWNGIMVEKLELFLRPNGQQVGWRVEPANATNPMITFLVDKPAQVEIDAAGYLHFLADCEVTVRGTTTDGSGISADLKVTGTAEHPHLCYPGPISMEIATETQNGSIPYLRCVVCKTVIHGAQGIDCAKILQLPDMLLRIDEEAFSGSTSFHQVNLPDGLTSIASRAFADCRDPLVVCVPDSVSSIADDAFEGIGFVILVCNDGSYAEQYAEKQGLMTAAP